MSSYFTPPRPRIFGHRGAAGVAPENTLPSFALGAALGASYLELDVHPTADGEIVVLHDPLVDRTTDGNGPIASMRWSDAARLDAGYHFTHDGRTFPYRGQGIRIPTLRELLQAYPAHHVNVEIKQGGRPVVDAVLDVLRAANSLDRVLLAAEHDHIMHTIREAVGDRVVTSMSTGEVIDFVGRFQSGDWSNYAPAGRALQIPPAHAGIELVTAETVEAAHRAKLEVHVWTINDSETIDRLLDLGVDGIMSDLPGLIAATVRRRA
jgi:glycerophosphoryl diester phosphodiesterase